MLYIVLKTILETTIHQYTCQTCQNKVNESAILIKSVSESMLNLNITCPHCGSMAEMHAEVANMDPSFLESEAWKKVIHKAVKRSENTIKDSDIQAIEKTLSETGSIEDLLK